MILGILVLIIWIVLVDTFGSNWFHMFHLGQVMIEILVYSIWKSIFGLLSDPILFGLGDDWTVASYHVEDYYCLFVASSCDLSGFAHLGQKMTSLLFICIDILYFIFVMFRIWVQFFREVYLDPQALKFLLGDGKLYLHKDDETLKLVGINNLAWLMLLKSSSW